MKSKKVNLEDVTLEDIREQGEKIFDDECRNQSIKASSCSAPGGGPSGGGGA